MRERENVTDDIPQRIEGSPEGTEAESIQIDFLKKATAAAHTVCGMGQQGLTSQGCAGVITVREVQLSLLSLAFFFHLSELDFSFVWHCDSQRMLVLFQSTFLCRQNNENYATGANLLVMNNTICVAVILRLNADKMATAFFLFFIQLSSHVSRLNNAN